MREEVNRMNKKLMKRMKLAGSYQKKAFRALLPENVSGHLDVIENEMKMIFMELATDAIKSGIMSGFEGAGPKDAKTGEEKREKTTGGVRKIDLG